MNSRLLYSLFLMLLLQQPCTTQAQGHWYIGLSGGETQFKNISSFEAPVEAFSLRNTMPGNSFGSGALEPTAGLITPKPAIKDDKRDNSWKIIAGYQFNRYFTIEGGFLNIGEARAQISTVSSGNLALPFSPVITISESVKYKSKGAVVSALGRYPVTDRIAVLANIGALYSESRISYRSTINIDALPVAGFSALPPAAFSYRKEDRDLHLNFGLGAEYSLSDTVSVRIAWNRYLNAQRHGRRKGNIDNYSVGLFYHFK